MFIHTFTTELIWFGSVANLSRLQNANLNIHIGQVTIEPVDAVCDLGVLLDSHLDMRQHISKTVSTCFYHLRRLRQLRRILYRDMRQRLISALIISTIATWLSLVSQRRHMRHCNES